MSSNSDYILCFSCEANCLNIEGETHKYMLSSPGCWMMFGEVLAREYEDIRYFRVHQFTVDAYACQHPGKKERRSINSVGIHLCSLYALLELDKNSQEVIHIRKKLSEKQKTEPFFRWLEPPKNMGELTVEYVWKAETPEQHCKRVHEWAASTWEAWQSHHQTIENWVHKIWE